MEVDAQDTPSRDDRSTRDQNSHRQRSPLAGERRVNAARNRSRSPTLIDRYQPDPNRDNRRGMRRENSGYDRHRGTPAHTSNIDRYVPGEQRTPQRLSFPNHIRDPLLEPSQVGFNHFAEWWKAEQDIKRQRERHMSGGRADPNPKETYDEQKSRIQAAYNDYRSEWNLKAAKAFVQAHKTEAWFRERYVPEFRDPIRQRIAAYRSELYDTWTADLENGVFDDCTMEGIPKTESNGAGGVLGREDGESITPTEVLAVNDLLPAKGADLRDQIASLPALLIKTITPTASRDTLEDFCKEKLGIGEGGFKWLSLSDPNVNKKYHRLGWVLLNSDQGVADDTIGASHRRDGSGEDTFADEDTTMATDHAKQDSISSRALQALDNKTMTDPERGEFTLHVGIHKTTEYPRKKALWDLFSAPDRILRDLELALRLVNKLDEQLGTHQRGVRLIEQRVDDLVGKGSLQPPIVSAKMSREANAGIDADDEIEEGEDVEADLENIDDEEMLIAKKKLDLLVEYLRRVHHCCFYCVFEADSVHELQRKCAAGHLRRPRASLTAAAREAAKATASGDGNADGHQDTSPIEEKKPRQAGGKSQLQKASNWVKAYEERLRQWLEPENADLKKLGGIPLEEGLEKELEPYVKQEDEAKYRCKVPECSKLFKGETFWRKHVEKRHVEWYDKLKEGVQLLNAYVLDPGHVAHGRTDAASNGHFPMPKDGMNGTPRNFQHGAMPFGNGFTPGAMGMPPAYSPFTGHSPIGMPPSYGSPAMHHGGPIRSGMRTNNGRAAGPYDRAALRRSIGSGASGGRAGSQHGGGGRMSPGAGRAPFVEGGLGTFNTSTAMEGRTMKSYNDLDATSGAPKEADALDY